jgi:uncharacterized membrane protein
VTTRQIDAVSVVIAVVGFAVAIAARSPLAGGLILWAGLLGGWVARHWGRDGG